MSIPLAYFLTFHTYSTWLHGRDTGSIDRDHNRPGEPLLPAVPGFEAYRARTLRESLYLLATETTRQVVLDAVVEVCRHRGWHLHAAHVRTTHVHVVVSGDAAPEKMLTDFKAYATRRLKTLDGEPARQHRWSHHGSTRYLWDDDSVTGAVMYTLEEQGEPMATYRAEEERRPSEPGA